MGLEEEVGEVDEEALRKEHDRDNSQEEKTDEGVRTYTFQKGITQIRILPQKKSATKKPWFKTVYEHYIAVNGKNRQTYCPSTWDEECPICEEGKNLYQSQEPENLEKSKELRPGRKFIANVLVLSDPGEKTSAKDGVQVLKMGVTVKKALLNLDRDFTGGWGNITDLKEGNDIRITRSGDTMQTTSYGCVGVPKQTNILETLNAQGVDPGTLTVYDLDDVLRKPEHDRLVAMLKDDFVPHFPSAAPTEVPDIPEEDDSQVHVDSQNTDVPSGLE